MIRTDTLLLFALVLLCIHGCTLKKENALQKKIATELYKIDSLLRDAAYSEAMAKTLEGAYYTSSGKEVPPFLAPGEATASVKKSLKEEMIAMNAAGFYALECGIGLLHVQTNKAPVALLQMIVDHSIDSAAVSLLNRFANATWKAGQPFRDINRITRSTFMGFNFLPEEEIKKDEDQIQRAAAILLAELQLVKDSSAVVQFEKIKTLMQSKDRTQAIAEQIHAAKYINLKQQVPPFLTPEQDTSVITKSVKDQKIAVNVAGFYALECGLNYFASQSKLPSQVLKSIADGSINQDDKMLLLRFANATWKAGQPFRSLNRIEKDNFIPFNLLSNDELEKDLVQIKAAAAKLLVDIE